MSASAARVRRRPHHVVMLAYPDVQILDVTGPLEVFSRAARWMQDHGLRRDLAYRVEVVAPRAGAFATSSGVHLVAERAYREVTRADTLLVAGGRGCAAARTQAPLLAWLRRMSGRVSRLGSVCTGELLLWMLEHLDQDLSVPRLAERIAMSERSFARDFVDGVGLAPGHYVRQIRLTAARQRLEQTDLPLQQIARRCGFGTPESLRRSFIASVGVTPGAYRDRFRGAARPAG